MIRNGAANLLEGTDEKTAGRRPIAGGHTIAELAADITTWIDEVCERLAGQKPQVSAERRLPAGRWPDLP
jgi:hypothetical protein